MSPFWVLIVASPSITRQISLSIASLGIFFLFFASNDDDDQDGGKLIKSLERLN